jgi:hypothetical protein
LGSIDTDLVSTLKRVKIAADDLSDHHAVIHHQKSS